MSNRLKVGWVHTIETMLGRGWSHRRIARALGIDRGTVARYAQSEGPGKCSRAPPGLEGGAAGESAACSDPKCSQGALGSATPDWGVEPTAVTAAESTGSAQPMRALPCRHCRQTGAGPFRQAASTRTSSESTASPASTTACGASCGVWAKAGRCRSVAWSAPADEAQVDSAKARPRGPTRRQEEAATPVPRGAELFTQGLQRGRLAAGRRDLSSHAGERIPPIRRRASNTGRGQSESRGAQGGLVRSGSESEDSILRRALRHHRTTHQAQNAPAQGQDRTAGRLRPGQRPCGIGVRQPGGPEPSPVGVGDVRRGHPHPRHHP